MTEQLQALQQVRVFCNVNVCMCVVCVTEQLQALQQAHVSCGSVCFSVSPGTYMQHSSFTPLCHAAI